MYNPFFSFPLPLVLLPSLTTLMRQKKKEKKNNNQGAAGNGEQQRCDMLSLPPPQSPQPLPLLTITLEKAFTRRRVRAHTHTHTPPIWPITLPALPMYVMSGLLASHHGGDVCSWCECVLVCNEIQWGWFVWVQRMSVELVGMSKYAQGKCVLDI